MKPISAIILYVYKYRPVGHRNIRFENTGLSYTYNRMVQGAGRKDITHNNYCIRRLYSYFTRAVPCARSLATQPQRNRRGTGHLDTAGFRNS